MKLNKAIELGKAGRWQEAQVRIRPGHRKQWFVMLLDAELKSFILADNEDQPIAIEEMNRIAEHIRSIGLKEFTVFL